MIDALNLQELDVDGALEDAAGNLHSRTAFLRKAGVGVGALVGGGAFFGGLPAIASAATIPASDIAILNFALTLEYLESAFYTEANSMGKLTDPETIRFASIVAEHESSHVLYLKQVLGAKAIPTPNFNFQGTTADQGMFQATADVLENTGVHAYLGQVANIKTKAVLSGAGRILPVEARHASWIRDIRFRGGTTSAETPAPAGFEDGFTKTQILTAVNATGFIVP